MSSIDQYGHRILGFITCPSDYDFVYKSETRKIGVYLLDESIPKSEIYFSGNKGDIVIGGGSGEAKALSINIKKLKRAMIQGKDIVADEIVTSYWDENSCFAFLNGFRKVGWDFDIPFKQWILGQVIGFLNNNYKNVLGPSIEKDTCQYNRQMFELSE